MSSGSPQSDHPFSVPGLHPREGGDAPAPSSGPASAAAPPGGADAPDHRVPASPRSSPAPFPGTLGSDTGVVPPAAPLLGRLPCVRCRYELQGLSVASRCPECGLPIGVTILAVVDPFAKEIQPIKAPRLIVMGTMLWAGAALAIILLIWTIRLSELSSTTWGTTYWPGWAPTMIVVLTLLAGLGAVAFVRPHAKLPLVAQLAAGAAVVLHLPLAYAHWQLYERIDKQRPAIDFFAMDVNVERVWLRVLIGVLGVFIVLGLRLNARALVARSLVLRTGRVDRQTLYALAASFGIGALGDLLRLGSVRLSPVVGEIVSSTGLMLVVLGSALATIGMIGVFIDTWRMRRTILSPPITMADVVERAPDAGAPNGPMQERPA